jgi:hypothetical protein
MIDRAARDDHARRLRSLALGRITNDDYEDNLPRSPDPSVYEVYANGGWLLYSDLEEYMLTGKKALPKEAKHVVARWIMFLRSDMPYLWSRRMGKPFLKRIAFVLTFGVAFRGSVLAMRRADEAGDKDYWPFYNRQQYEAALTQPSFLGGRNG